MSWHTLNDGTTIDYPHGGEALVTMCAQRDNQHQMNLPGVGEMADSLWDAQRALGSVASDLVLNDASASAAATLADSLEHVAGMLRAWSERA